MPVRTGVNLRALPTDRAIDSVVASATAKEAPVSRRLRVQARSRDAISAAVCRAVFAEVFYWAATIERAMLGHHIRRRFLPPQVHAADPHTAGDAEQQGKAIE
jgi:hypothetical protein